MGGTPLVAPSEIPARRSPGETVALREIWAGRVWYARPAVVVSDEENLQVFHVPPHVRCKHPVAPDGTPLRIPADPWHLEDVRRGDTRIVSFAFAGTPYGVILPFGPDGRLREYYVNLQSPLRRSVPGFDTVEHLLDVRISPDRSSWSWKDEDELEIAVQRDLFTIEDAAWFRHWGERAVEHVLLREPPFDRDWTVWQPDPAWNEIDLPDMWDLAPA